jgi:hypothetical protein
MMEITERASIDAPPLAPADRQSISIISRA